jgi:hypothetical protein
MKRYRRQCTLRAYQVELDAVEDTVDDFIGAINDGHDTLDAITVVPRASGRFDVIGVISLATDHWPGRDCPRWTDAEGVTWGDDNAGG